MNTPGLTDEPCGQGGLGRWKKVPGGLVLVAFGIGVMLVHPGTLPLTPAAEEPPEEVLRLDGAPDVQPVRMNHAHQMLAAYLAKRYRIAQDATEQLVGVAYDAGERVGLDPLLILAVMAIESRFNPIAESETGAQGLMQIMPKIHKDKIAEYGSHSFLDPVTNVLVGSRILKEYIARTGSLEAGLQFYAGALEDTDSVYAQKVIAEQERLRQAVQRSERMTRASAV